MSGRVRGWAITDRSISRRTSATLVLRAQHDQRNASIATLLDALDSQREDRLHRGSAAINVQQLAGDEARLVSAEENHGVADVGWQAEAPHGRPAALVPVLDHLEHLGRQPAEDAVVAGARTDDVHRDALLGESDREIASQRLLRGFR